MFKLYNLYEQVILESIQRDKIFDAINNRVRVNITYDDGSGNPAPGKRTIEVYVYGALSNGSGVIRAYQIFGDTKTFKPMWKIFRVDKIMSWEPTNFVFYTPISDRDPSLRGKGMAYREDGLDDMIPKVYAFATFNDKYDNERTGDTSKIEWQPRPDTKSKHW